jgi:hypothetical protein
MDTLTPLDRATILRTVRAWPDDEQLRLIQDVLDMIRTARTMMPRHATLAEARGLLKADRPPPTDVEVQQWLDDRRIERYGT